VSVSDLVLVYGVFAAYLLAVFSPLIIALFLVARAGPRVPRRATFVFAATALAYGAALFAWVLVVVPVRLFAVYVYPILVANDPAKRAWEALWVPLYRIGEPQQYALSVALLVVACCTVLYLWRRWPTIAHALA
jgi:hypothetical protein